MLFFDLNTDKFMLFPGLTIVSVNIKTIKILISDNGSETDKQMTSLDLAKYHCRHK